MGSALLVLVPTYNERDNVERLCREILALDAAPDLLFVDDDSADGTGRILDRLAHESPRVQVLHRARKLGIGSAHAAGIAWAYEHDCRLLVTMDGDFTHDPLYVPALLAAADGADVVVGSRHLEARSLADWSLHRRFLTHLGHRLSLRLLDLPYDATNAFRLYRLDTIPRHAFDLVRSSGYAFFFESLHLLHRNGLRIAEVPMRMPRRVHGSSKMGLRDVRESGTVLLRTWLRVRVRPERFEIGAPRDGDATFDGTPGVARVRSR